MPRLRRAQAKLFDEKCLRRSDADVSEHNHKLDSALLPFYDENRKLSTVECGEVQYLTANHAPGYTIAASLNVIRAKTGTTGRVISKDVHNIAAKVRKDNRGNLCELQLLKRSSVNSWRNVPTLYLSWLSVILKKTDRKNQRSNTRLSDSGHESAMQRNLEVIFTDSTISHSHIHTLTYFHIHIFPRVHFNFTGYHILIFPCSHIHTVPYPSLFTHSQILTFPCSHIPIFIHVFIFTYFQGYRFPRCHVPKGLIHFPHLHAFPIFLRNLLRTTHHP